MTPLTMARQHPQHRQEAGVQTRTPLITLDALALRLINRYQHDMPVCARPYSAMANTLGCTEAEVLKALNDLALRGTLSRIGPVFEHRKAGASTLAAMAVPAHRLDEVARHVGSHVEVNHNYERDHEWNLWFVVTAPDQDRVDGVLKRIECATGLGLISLPMIEPYHIDLGFRLAVTADGTITIDAEQRPHAGAEQPSRSATLSSACHAADTCVVPAAATERAAALCLHQKPAMTASLPLSEGQRQQLRRLLEHGLSLRPRPYETLAWQITADEAAVLEQVQAWQRKGLFRRHGVVLRHHALGISANLMLVMDIDDAGVRELGSRLASEPGITLCYRRERHLPQWRYNLYCMIHGHDRRAVAMHAGQLLARHRLENQPHQFLFSLRAFKQRGGRYAAQHESTTPLRPTTVNYPEHRHE